MKVIQTQRRREPLIGILLPTHWHYFREILIGIRDWCEQQARFKTKFISDNGTHDMKHSPLAGVIFATPITSVVTNLESLGVPLLSVTNRHNSNHLPQLFTDDDTIGTMAADYFHRKGFRQVAYQAHADLQFSAIRGHAFALRATELGMQSTQLPTIGKVSSNEEMIENLRRGGPVGVFAMNDAAARGIIEILTTRGVRVPGEVAVLGVDDDPLQNALSSVSLSSVKLAGHAVGMRAAATLCNLIQNRQTPPFPLKIPPVGIVSRRSTDLYAVDDPLAVSVIRLLRQRIAEFADVHALVSHMQIPRRTLERRFRLAVGHSLHDELTHVRITRAKELLATSDASIASIAEQIGLSEPRFLSILFKRATGLTPSAFRQQFTK